MTMAIDFLTFDDIVRIYQDQINRYSGKVGIHDLNALLSAIAMPQATFEGEYLHKDICEMAAAYLFHLVQNDPFIDGNKRVGTVAALVFLDLNDVEIDVDDDELAAFVFGVASGTHGPTPIRARTSIAVPLSSHGDIRNG